MKKDGTKHRYYPDFILTKTGKIWDPKGDNSFDENGKPIKNGKYDWTEKYEYMKSLGVWMPQKKEIKPFQDWFENKFGKDYIDTLRFDEDLDALLETF